MIEYYVKYEQDTDMSVMFSSVSFDEICEYVEQIDDYEYLLEEQLIEIISRGDFYEVLHQ